MYIAYQLIRSKRKSIAIQVTEDGEVVVRAPLRTSVKQIEQFLLYKRTWVEAAVKKAQKAASERQEFAFSEEEIKRYRETARSILTQKAAYYGRIMGLSYNRIAIRDQKTRWGSCSSRGNINFSWRLILMPEEILDYVVVHELAHLREMNHSRRFYAVVESVLPDYRGRQKWLRENGRKYR